MALTSWAADQLHLIRSYALAVSALCRGPDRRAYGQAAECEMRLGTYPVQAGHEQNSAVQVQQPQAAEGNSVKRTFTVDELQAFSGHAHKHAEFGACSLCRVQFSKAGRGSPPERRTVLTVWPWLPGVLE